MMVFGKENAAGFLTTWLQDKDEIVLVSGKSSFSKCGAETWLRPFLSGKNVLHLVTAGENARTENVEELLLEIKTCPDAYIAVGGGSVIDTTKLLRTGFPPVSETSEYAPFLAIPTTAGTGAEATRFAVYYDHGKKCSADDVRYLPTDQILIQEFCDSATQYQKAVCAFDAYAQAVESLWAKGATEESRSYALKALDLMEKGEQLLGSYWAGRAIDISRTTAAHAFSYYMTATYAVPHGEAVYMMFPAVCRANGHTEYIKEVPELRTLEKFIEEKSLDKASLMENLFANVNPARLGNNPCEVRKDHFNG